VGNIGISISNKKYSLPCIGFASPLQFPGIAESDKNELWMSECDFYSNTEVFFSVISDAPVTQYNV